MIFEHRGLAPYASHGPQSRGRLLAEDDGREATSRSPFQRDRDRIIHSGAFRRLKHKTQVFVYHEGDYFRTRLTHSLEVAQIARSMARALHLNDDLAEAVALAHDLGHTPFGHAGEDALNRAMQNYGGFNHNDQTIRVITHLEQRYAGFNGLNLSWETIEGVVKHNGPLTCDAVDRNPVSAINRQFHLELENHASGEAQLANLADDIAYLSHDFDDGLRAGLFRLEDICHLPQVSTALQDINQRYGTIDLGRTTHELVRRLISVFVEDLLAVSSRNLAEGELSTADDIRKAGRPLIAFSVPMAADLDCLSNFLFQH